MEMTIHLWNATSAIAHTTWNVSVLHSRLSQMANGSALNAPMRWMPWQIVTRGVMKGWEQSARRQPPKKMHRNARNDVGCSSLLWEIYV